MKILERLEKTPKYETVDHAGTDEYVAFKLIDDERFSDIVYHYTVITPVEEQDDDGNDMFYLRFEYNLLEGEVPEELVSEFEEQIASVLYEVVVSYAESAVEKHK